ncbi:MAG: flagellar basal body P-ring formation chaperone FlgA [Pelagimonas sp.]|uniref:flagellar basal body P-ring formation chaperone FlgA n=1 Tax=Pelagimonas sp. TaxID=2073170 RepID=UPI003D6BE8DF
MKLLLAFLPLLATQVAADTIVATRSIRPQQLITAEDVRSDPSDVEGAYTFLGEVIGNEARVAIYPGRAVMFGQVGRPALVERNQMVELIFSRGGLRIAAEGRALARGGSGERIRVMNTDSRTVLFGTITENGTVLVSN